MKKITTLSLFVVLAVGAVAQQSSHYTQYMMNNFAFNPAVAGSKDCINMKVGYREQWRGFEGNPNTAFATIHSAIAKRGVRNNSNNHAIGLRLINDETGITARTSLNFAYSYHMKVSKKYVLSSGLFAGFLQYKMEGNEIEVGNYADPAIGQSQSVIVAPDLTFGLWLYSNRDYAGLSINKVVESKIPDVGIDTYFSRSYILTAGRKYGDLRGINFIPSFKMEYVFKAPVSVDLSFVVDYNNQFGVGVNYRVEDGVGFMARASFFRYFTFGYSYDLVSSDIKYGGSDTHEILLGITACPKDGRAKSIECPTYF
ncbi:MAG: type IX secretion system PorP/SprF family membrane protein [Flavobacteriales bacterium]|jgi:type IX secretion system PorP/SprF family membrane protein